MEALAHEPGVVQPPEMKLLEALSQVAGGYGVGRMAGGLASALGGRSIPQVAEATYPAIHPSELPAAEQGYKSWENAYNRHMANYDFANALKDKWGMLKNAGGN